MNKEVMYKIGYGLYVLTSRTGDFLNGCIINTAIQVTSSPNRIAVTVNKTNKTHELIEKSGIFNISVISEDADFELFKHFGFQSGRDVDKFEFFNEKMVAENNVYYITKGTNAYISGKVINKTDLGTHTMFIADVTGGEILSDVESATYSYYQKNIKPAPEKKEALKSGVKSYRCKICGYIHEGELPDGFICPICKHGKDDFEEIQVL